MLKLKIKLPPQPDRLKPVTPVLKTKTSKKRKRSSLGLAEDLSKPMSKKMRESLALNAGGLRFSGSEEDRHTTNIRPFTSQNKTYCFCKAPHDEVRDRPQSHSDSIQFICNSTSCLDLRDDRVRRPGLFAGVVPLRVRGDPGAAAREVVLSSVLSQIRAIVK